MITKQTGLSVLYRRLAACLEPMRRQRRQGDPAL